VIGTIVRGRVHAAYRRPREREGAPDKAVEAHDRRALRCRNPPNRVETAQENDIFAKIKRLADLHQKGILSAEEFATKKAELLSRPCDSRRRF
jgi:hypothetical protein